MIKPKRPVGTYKQNDLFHEDKDYLLNACVGRNGGPYDFYAYSRGYFRAGNFGKYRFETRDEPW